MAHKVTLVGGSSSLNHRLATCRRTLKLDLSANASLTIDDDDDMAMSVYTDDFRVSTEPKRKAYDVDYESLSKAAVEAMMKKEVDECKDMLGIEVSICSRRYGRGALGGMRSLGAVRHQ